MAPRRSSIRTLALALSCIGIAAVAPAGAEAQKEKLGGVEGTEVRVARGEVTIVFPQDTASDWGWASGDAGRPYTWRVSMDDEGAPRSIILQVHPFSRRRYWDLEALVSGSQARVCWPAEPDCDSKRVRASVWAGRLVLSLRDSAAISEVFGLRPETATAYLWRPGMERAAESPVRVTYVDPQLPLPDSALRAAAAERRRSHFARVQRATRTIVPDLWLVRGDSAVAHVQERRCSYGTCVASVPGFPDARWSVADSSIARVRPTGTGTVQVIGLRPGRTTLRAAGLHGPRDTLPEWNPMPSETEREVVVTLPVAAVRLCPRRHIITGEPVPLHVEVVDSGGNVFRDPPVGIRVDAGSMVAPSDAIGKFEGTGSVTFSVAFAGHSDSLRLRVVPRSFRSVIQPESNSCSPSALTSAIPAPPPAPENEP